MSKPLSTTLLFRTLKAVLICPGLPDTAEEVGAPRSVVNYLLDVDPTDRFILREIRELLDE